MEKVCEFLKSAGTYYLATVEGDQPRVRPFGTAHIFEGKLYIQTGKIKPVSKQIAANPKVTFVAAHPGQKADFLLHLERLEKYANAFLDLSGTGLFRYGMLREGIRRVGAEKFLFGTDYPITNPGMYVQAVCYEHISEADREKIFYKNAERILGITM